LPHIGLAVTTIGGSLAVKLTLIVTFIANPPFSRRSVSQALDGLYFGFKFIPWAVELL
jgi:hypothetical protein